MQYKNTKKIMLDQRKLETLFRIGCPDNLIIELLKTGTFTPTGDSLIDDNLESLIDHKIFNNKNWGGKREGAGRPKNNQDENQDENQDKNQDTDIDKDIDIYNNTRNSNKGGMGGKEKGGFVPPTLEEVLEYAREQNNFAGVGGFACTDEQATDFFNHYDRQGWLLGNGIHMANWHSGLMKWAKEQNKQPQRPNKPTVLNLTARERQDLINKEKTQALLKQLKAQGN